MSEVSMFNLFQSKPTGVVRADSDDSDSSFVLEIEQTCVIQSNSTIVSNVSAEESRVKFTRGSFAFSLTDENSILLQFHPIFLWRMILFYESKKNDEEIVDFTQLRSFVSKFMRKRGFNICFTVSNCDIQYILDDAIVAKPVSCDVFAKVIVLFNKLHMSLKRRYDSYELIDSMLDEAFKVLRIVSGI
jgi:hypothetical protein